MTLADDEGFGPRARREAQRYGSDPWIFLRELLQNARDAGARSVVITTGGADGRETVACRDDGRGMSLAHARRYLFTLYASSKEAGRGSAGRFGVGFWSVLLFGPSRITIDSLPASGVGWRIELEGSLERFDRAPGQLRAPGTCITLERLATEPRLRSCVVAAARRAVRGLRRIDRDQPVSVTVDGREVNRPLSLPAPSLSFKGRSARGVVALGAAPRVDLYARGLHVRTATELGDLLSSHDPRRDAAAGFSGGDERGLAPQALLDGDGLNVLLARADVGDDRALRRLVSRGRVELARLVERQIDALRPRSPLRRVADWLADRSAVPHAVVIATSALFGALAVWAYTSTPAPRSSPELASPIVAGPPRLALGAKHSMPTGSAWAYRDLARDYRGPRIDPVQGLPRPALRYRPPDGALHVAAMLVSHMDDSGAPVLGGVTTTPYVGVRCGPGCVELELPVDADPGALRVPVPTGHRLVANSLTLGTGPARVTSTTLGEPVLALDSRTTGLLRYRTSPSRATGEPPTTARPVPPPLAGPARTLLDVPAADRLEGATRWVANTIRYSSSAAMQGGASTFLERALATGRGDCDVQNAVLAELLSSLGFTSRLAIGFVGQAGVATDRLHAWVEFRNHDGPWEVADASLEPGSPLPASAAPTTPGISRAPSDPVVVGLLAAAGLALVGFIALSRGRLTRVLRTDSGREAADLVRGALQHPDAFAGAPAVFRRRLLPTLNGPPLTLGEAWNGAYRQTLYSGQPGSRISRASARAGIRVLDTAYPESAAAAELLGAVSLPAWDRLVPRSRETPLLARANAAFAAVGEPWRVRAAPVTAPTALELPRSIELSHGLRIFHLLLVDGERPELATEAAQLDARPAEATLVALTYLAEALELPADRRAALLSPIASQVIAEASA